MSRGPSGDYNVPDFEPGEQRVFFEGDRPLEGMFGWPDRPIHGGRILPMWEIRGGVVVAHPYPPHGANMDLPVIHRIAKSCRRSGFATLRFNFRSVGASRGSFSGSEEHRDVMAAVSFMKEQLEPEDGAGEARPPIGLVGWSFGSIMAARAVAELPAVKALALVGFGVLWEGLPPDTLERLSRFRGPVLAVCAENDDVGSPTDVDRALAESGLEHTLEVVKGADHFLEGRHREVGKMVAEFFFAVLGTEKGDARE
jgi:alpha/beta superfamily hydrolase